MHRRPGGRNYDLLPPPPPPLVSPAAGNPISSCGLCLYPRRRPFPGTPSLILPGFITAPRFSAARRWISWISLWFFPLSLSLSAFAAWVNREMRTAVSINDFVNPRRLFIAARRRKRKLLGCRLLLPGCIDLLICFFS